MMDAAGSIFSQKTGDGRIFAQGMQKLDLGIGQVNEDYRPPMLGYILGRRNFRSEDIPVSL